MRFASIAAEIRACRICRDAPRGPPLPHEPRPVFQGLPSARLLIAGQAPGARVHASGRPYTDPSGHRLRAWMGVDEATFYDPDRVAIVPMGLCFPGYDGKGGDLPPRRECVSVWHDRLMAFFPEIELVLAIGLYAQRYHLARLGLSKHLKPRLTDTIAGWRAIYDGGSRPRVLVMPHPSWRNTGWLKRHSWFDGDVVPVLRAEIARLVGSSSRVDFPFAAPSPILPA